ncbi:hypothetical protein Goarm_002249 [Gossypium armourianum]|uniref:Uncharacterized protein n=1 Tax=Gossypium armourianum TaxID=34283 RepID=A0A7J9K7H8_9ROSI|nr:hypothetical protein [Gossypium armourianum]
MCPRMQSLQPMVCTSFVIILKAMQVKFEVQKMEEWVPPIRSK